MRCMRLCFDATRFGCPLDDAVELAAQKGVPAVEFSFAAFPMSSNDKLLDEAENQYLRSIKELSRRKNVELACLNLDFCLNLSDRRLTKKFSKMLIKLGCVAKCLGCPCVAVSILPSAKNGWIESAAEELLKMQAALSENDVHLLLRLATPKDLRGQSLKKWQAMEPQDWRDIISLCPGLSLSFSPADCLWLGIDYLKILSGLVSAIEHVEAHDIEINRALLTDSGIFGPLWWRYRIPGKGQVDWRQLIEALKLYDFKGTFSIHLDDEFIGEDFQSMYDALEQGINVLSPLLKG